MLTTEVPIDPLYHRQNGGPIRFTLRQLTDRLGSPTLRTVTDASGIYVHSAVWPCGCRAVYERVGDVDLRGCTLHPR